MMSYSARVMTATSPVLSLLSFEARGCMFLCLFFFFFFSLSFFLLITLSRSSLPNNRFTGTIPASYAALEKVSLEGTHYQSSHVIFFFFFFFSFSLPDNFLTGTIPFQIIESQVSFYATGNNFVNCTVPPGAILPANASCYDLCLPPDSSSCNRNPSIFLTTCVRACPPLLCSPPQPTPSSICNQGTWLVNDSLSVDGNLTITISPVIIDGNFTFADDSFIIVTLSGYENGLPRINVSGLRLKNELLSRSTNIEKQKMQCWRRVER